MQKGMEPEVNVYKMLRSESFPLSYSHADNQPQHQYKAKGNGCEETALLLKLKTESNYVSSKDTNKG